MHWIAEYCVDEITKWGEKEQGGAGEEERAWGYRQDGMDKCGLWEGDQGDTGAETFGVEKVREGRRPGGGGRRQTPSRSASCVDAGTCPEIHTHLFLWCPGDKEEQGVWMQEYYFTFHSFLTSPKDRFGYPELTLRNLPFREGWIGKIIQRI